MDVVITIFYSVAIAWIGGLMIVAIIKKVQAKKKAKANKKDSSNEDSDVNVSNN